MRRAGFFVIEMIIIVWAMSMAGYFVYSVVTYEPPQHGMEFTDNGIRR